MEYLLERSGFEVITAKDGIDAIATLEEHTPAAMLLDIEMPRMDGLETLNTVRRLRPDIPILLFSGYTERAAEIEGLQDQRTAFLEKPFRTRILGVATGAPGLLVPGAAHVRRIKHVGRKGTQILRGLAPQPHAVDSNRHDQVRMQLRNSSR